MKITNIHNLPDSIYSAVSKYIYKPNPSRISVTDLINAPQIRQLKIKHWDQLEEDASDRFWALLGSSIHSVLERTNIDNSLSEEKLSYTFSANFEDWTIAGRPDLWINNEIHDYKVTSVWSYIYGKPEWEIQLNVYAWLFDKFSFRTNKLKIYAILRDWQRNKALGNNDYPVIPFAEIGVLLWPLKKTEEYIKQRLELHSKTDVPCTPADQWEKPTKWALMKKGNKRATKIFDKYEIAERVRMDKDDKTLYVEERKGSKPRCEDYCIVRNFCNQKLAEDFLTEKKVSE